MDRQTRRFLREIAYYGSIGMSVALSIVIGLFIGVLLDTRVWDTSPVFTLIFLGLGIAAGFKNIFLAMKKSQKL
ncbi:MAG: AtpZ/AtpI family protein [Deltaproteobacteria bacterium]|nr:AtpZ/AtpI family protein [Deltaproteobacteria bacterium]